MNTQNAISKLCPYKCGIVLVIAAMFFGVAMIALASQGAL